jgi:hypothetical protein
MNCDAPPTHDCVWADGRGRAWFCDKHWSDFKRGKNRDIVMHRQVKDGEVEPKYRRDWRTAESMIDELIGAQMVPNQTGGIRSVEPVQRTSRTPPQPVGAKKQKGGRKPRKASAAGYPTSMFAASRSPRIESMIDDIVSGAVFDFAGRLTTLDKGMSVGAKHNAAPMADQVARWCRSRDVSYDNARVKDWQTAEELIDRVLDGDDVDEVTRTVMIAKYPKPMGLVRQTRDPKKKRRKNYIVNYNEPDNARVEGTADTAFTPHAQTDFSRVDPTNPWRKKTRRAGNSAYNKPTHQRNEDLFDHDTLVDRAELFLWERKRAPTMIMYHGTSTKFLSKILKQGLIPNPTMRVWKDDKSAARSTAQHSRASLDSVYFAKNFMTAVSSGGNAHRKFGGTYLFVAAQIQPRSAFADEDTVKLKAEKALRSVLGYSDDYSHRWWEMFALDQWKRFGREIAEKLKEHITAAQLPFGIGAKGAKIPIDVKGCTDYLRGLVEQDVAKRYKEKGDALIRDNMWRTKSDHAGNAATPEQREGVFQALKRNMPTLRDAEARYLKGLESLSIRYKGLAMPERPDAPDALTGFSHTLRIPETVAYRGRNKILAVFQVWHDMNHYKRPSYIIVHYGRVTSTMVADMVKSSFVKAKPTIMTAREAKRKGLFDQMKRAA